MSFSIKTHQLIHTIVRILLLVFFFFLPSLPLTNSKSLKALPSPFTQTTQMPGTLPFHLIMDSLTEFVGTVKAKKAKAALRHRRTSRLKTLMHVLEACAALFVLLSWCSGGGLSPAFDSTVVHSLRLLHILRRPLSVFVLINVLIVVIVLLSSTGNEKNKTGPAADFSERIYDEYLSRQGTGPTQATSDLPWVPEKSPEETSAENLQIVPYVAVEAKPDEPEKPVEPEVSQVVRSTPIIRATIEKEGRHYRRTRSELAARPCRRAEDRALTRSMTENRRAAAGGDPPRRSVDDLSNEEFNRTVENYISRTRWVLQRELMADLTVVSHSDSNINMALTVGNR